MGCHPSLVDGRSPVRRAGAPCYDLSPGAGRRLAVRNGDEPDEDPMANIESQIKRNRQNAARHERSKAIRSEVKTRAKRAVAAAEAGAEDAGAKLEAAVRRIDKAAAKGVIHANQAARRKSRLMRSVNLAGSPTEA